MLGSPPKDAKVWCEEIFGPVGDDRPLLDFEEALRLANDSKFGLQAGVFTRDMGRGLQAARTLEFGGVLINEVPTYRADQQPYGGVKDSGNTREGPAVRGDRVDRGALRHSPGLTPSALSRLPTSVRLRSTDYRGKGR